MEGNNRRISSVTTSSIFRGMGALDTDQVPIPLNISGRWPGSGQLQPVHTFARLAAWSEEAS